MLRKMLKYDIKAMAQTFLPFYAVILIMSVLNSIFINFDWLYGIVGGSTILVGLFIALGVTTLVLIVTQFYKNVLGDQGYLTNTLPVSVDTIICSKLISAALWICLSGIVAMIVGFILLCSVSPLTFSDVWQAASSLFGQIFDAIFAVLGGEFQILFVLLWILLMVLIVLAAIANDILHFYCAMSCSQLRPFSKNRIAASFIAYIIINIPLSVLTGLVFSCMALVSDRFQNFFAGLAPETLFTVALFTVAAIFVAMDILLYLPTRYILKNKLNLE